MSKENDILDLAAIDKILAGLPEATDHIWEKLGLTPRQYEMYQLFNPQAPIITGLEKLEYSKLLKEELDELGLALGEVKL
jgi:hypothetical protein